MERRACAALGQGPDGSRAVLEDACGGLDAIAGVQLEMPLMALCQPGRGVQAGVGEHMAGRGFALVSLEPAWSGPVWGRLLQVDGTFIREG